MNELRVKLSEVGIKIGAYEGFRNDAQDAVQSLKASTITNIKLNSYLNVYT